MMRFFVRGAAVWALALVVQPIGAQQNVGCDGAVVLKAGRSGPCTTLAQQISKLIDDPAVARDHWGIDVVAMDGAPIYSLNDGQLFQPASNAKLFTTAAAIALLGPEKTFETRVVARGSFDGVERLTGDLVLVGGGDANLSGRTLPYVSRVESSKSAPPVAEPLRYLEAMADQIAASGLKVVTGDVVGDDTLFPYEPYAPDWTIEDAVWNDGAPVSALSINDNTVHLKVMPAGVIGREAVAAMEPPQPYYTVEMNVTTGPPKSDTVVRVDRPMGSKVVRVYGTIAVDARPDISDLAIADPAEYGAMALKQMLELRGISVAGKAAAVHTVSTETRGFLKISQEPFVAHNPGVQQTDTIGGGCSDCPSVEYVKRMVASHRSPALGEDIVVTNKVSQNLHAELMLHQMGLIGGGDGSTAQGARVVRQFLLNAGIDKDDFVFFDGSGLSGHDLVTPRATVRLLQYAAGQPWFADWKRSLPVGGVDGSLEGRFTKAPLKGKVFAKTGTLGEARALSGYVECASGRTVIFSILVGNHLPGSNADRETMDRMVGAIAAEN